jgi:hypothetical protein
MRTVVGVFPSRTEAEHVARDLKALGISGDEVTIADEAGADNHEWSRRNLAACGGLSFGWLLAGLIPLITERSRAAATGLGASTGAVAGLIAGMAALMVTGGAPIIAGSVIATVLAALCIGAIGGGLITAVYTTGVSHEGIPLTSEAVREHGAVLAAHVDLPRQQEALRVMSEHGARQTCTAADAWIATGWPGPHPVEEPYPSDSSYVSHPARKAS